MYSYSRHNAYLLSGLVVAAGLLAAPLMAHALITQQLDRGESGAEVTELQTFLAAYPTYYPEGLITGYFGPLTEMAVERFQCASGLVCSGSPTTTGYGRVGPDTMIALNAAMADGAVPPGGGTGGADDMRAPVMGSTTVSSLTGTSATITWTTNETAMGRVMYGTTWPFLYAAAPEVSESSYGTVHTVTLSNLAPNTPYFYVAESEDVAGNIQWTTAETFATE